MTITIHEASLVSGSIHVNAHAKVAAGAESSLIALPSFCDDAQAAMDGIQLWSRRTAPRFAFRGLDVPGMHEAIAALCKVGAYPGKEAALEVASNAEMSEALEALQQSGFVIATEAQGPLTKWQLTDTGARGMTIQHCLITASPALAPRSDLALDAMTNFEVLFRLGEDGWQLQRAPSKAEQKLALPPYSAGGPKHLFVYGPDVSRQRSYLLCAASIGTLFDAGVVQMAHCQDAKYYKNLLTGKSDGRVRVGRLAALALENDVEEEGEDIVPILDAADDAGIVDAIATFWIMFIS